jgi:hypothetical protein
VREKFSRQQEEGDAAQWAADHWEEDIAMGEETQRTEGAQFGEEDEEEDVEEEEPPIPPLPPEEIEQKKVRLRVLQAELWWLVGTQWEPKPWPVFREAPYHPRVPLSMPPGDDRFHKTKKNRVFVCDSCKHVVRYSSFTRDGRSRGVSEFQGSYVNHDWARLPQYLQSQAWLDGFIDATWYCTMNCGKSTTGQDNQEKRELRASTWRQQKQDPNRAPQQHFSSARQQRNWGDTWQENWCNWR